MGPWSPAIKINPWRRNGHGDSNPAGPSGPEGGGNGLTPSEGALNLGRKAPIASRCPPRAGATGDPVEEIRSSLARWTALLVVLALSPVLLADTLVLLDGTEMTGEVLDLSAEVLHLRDTRGNLVTVNRSKIARILFVTPPPKLKVDLRCAAADDELDLLLNGDPVQERVGALGSGWLDVTDRLQQGNNQIQVRVRNERASWGYRWELRINGKVSVFSCGQPGTKGKGCTCCGMTGNETGEIGPLEPLWLHVNRAAGAAEVVGR